MKGELTMKITEIQKNHKQLHANELNNLEEINFQKHNLSRLKQEDLHNWDRPIIIVKLSL